MSVLPSFRHSLFSHPTMSSNEAGPSRADTITEISTTSRTKFEQDSIRHISNHFDDNSFHLSEDDVGRLMQSVIASIVRKQGYDSISSSAMQYIVESVEYVMTGILEYTNELAMVARRRIPSTRDAYSALQNAGPRIQPHSLIEYAKDHKDDVVPAWKVSSDLKRSKLSEWKTPEDGWLSSDEEEVEEEQERESRTEAGRNDVHIRTKRRRKLFKAGMDEVPAHLPPLPPKHTWLSTPSYPIRTENTMDPLAFIDIKVSSTRLTEASLRGLISATEMAAFTSRERKSHDEITAKEKDPKPASKTDLFNGRKGSISSPALTTASSGNDEDGPGTRFRKGRALSLRLRSIQTPQTPMESSKLASSSTNEDSSEVKSASPASQSPTHLKQTLTLPQKSSLSLSLSGIRSANSVASPSPFFGRNRTVQTPSSAGGPWTSAPTQSYFTWGPPMPSIGTTPNVPLATPLTPGAGFVYPPTPSELYTTNHLSANLGSEKESAEDVSLPGVVNYKRSWYRKGNAVKKENIM